MSLHVRLYTNFWTHRKTAKLRSILGNDAFWLPPRLWCYAAENQPDGDFSSYSPEELAMLLGYTGDAQAMLQAMQQACFMVGMKINDWETHNGYHHEFSERAKKAANARWEKERSKENGKDRIRKERKGDKHCLEHSSSIIEPKKEQGFDEFWALYPKRKAKGEAMKAWKSIRPAPELTVQILKAVSDHSQLPEWKKENGQFIPLPATWLRGARWEDEVAVKKVDSFAEFVPHFKLNQNDNDNH